MGPPRLLQPLREQGRPPHTPLPCCAAGMLYHRSPQKNCPVLGLKTPEGDSPTYLLHLLPIPLSTSSLLSAAQPQALPWCPEAHSASLPSRVPSALPRPSLGLPPLSTPPSSVGCPAARHPDCRQFGGRGHLP